MQTGYRLGGLFSFVLGAGWFYRWEFLRAFFYDKGFRAVEELGFEQFIHYGVPLILVGAGLILFFKTGSSANPFWIVENWPVFGSRKPDRIALHDFIFTESPKVGWQRDGQDDSKGFMTLIPRLEQAAVDNEIHFRGRVPPNLIVGADGPLLLIPAAHWDQFQIDLISAVFKPNAENFSNHRFSGLDDAPGYFDLHLDRKEALRWLRSRGRP